jgi:hypothetical protein
VPLVDIRVPLTAADTKANLESPTNQTSPEAGSPMARKALHGHSADDNEEEVEGVSQASTTPWGSSAFSTVTSNLDDAAFLAAVTEMEDATRAAVGEQATDEGCGIGVGGGAAVRVENRGADQEEVMLDQQATITALVNGDSDEVELELEN